MPCRFARIRMELFNYRVTVKNLIEMNNKKIFFLSIFIVGLTIFSCSKEEPLVVKKSLESIKLNDVRNLIPIQLQQNISVVYNDENGNERKLVTSYDSIKRIAKVDESEYNQERFSILYVDPNDSSFTMDISADGVYTSELDVQKTISTHLMPRSQTSSSMVIEVLEGELVVQEWNDFHTSLILNSREFNNVFIGKNDFNETGEYDQIMFNEEVGVVAFKDNNNVLWVFNKFEK